MLFSRFNFFELDTSTSDLTLRRLFAAGQSIFFTDQALQDSPSAVLDVIRHIEERNKEKLPGSESRRIFARPGVTQWLFDLATNDTTATDETETVS